MGERSMSTGFSMMPASQELDRSSRFPQFFGVCEGPDLRQHGRTSPSNDVFRHECEVRRFSSPMTRFFDAFPDH